MVFYPSNPGHQLKQSNVTWTIAAKKNEIDISHYIICVYLLYIYIYIYIHTHTYHYLCIIIIIVIKNVVFPQVQHPLPRCPRRPRVAFPSVSVLAIDMTFAFDPRWGPGPVRQLPKAAGVLHQLNHLHMVYISCEY